MNEMYLAGEWVKREEGINVINPENGKVITSVPKGSREDMELAILKAKEAFKVSKEMPVHERSRILHKVVEYVSKNHEEFAVTIATEGSKTINEARGEVTRCIETIKISAEETRNIKGQTISFDQMPGSENRTGYYYRFPIGIIGAITPFNDPLNLVAHKVGPAIASGNVIIVKPATVTPLSALLLAKAFDYAGLPKGVLSVITGNGSEVGDVLVTHPDVRMISFTGGMEAGEKISNKAGLKKIGMELGSNSPVIIEKDAKINEAVKANVSGAFWAAGQNCLGVQRILIQEEIYEKFKDEFVEKTKLYKTGSKLSELTDVGPLIDEKEAIRVEKWIIDAVDKGADLLCGGKRDGSFLKPTVLENISSEAILDKQEVFGPVVVLYKYKTLNEAIEKANEVDFGLQAGIFTQDIDNAFKAIHGLNVGGVMVNDSTDYRIDAMPFGGVKKSGLGREGVQSSIHEMTEPKVVCLNLRK